MSGIQLVIQSDDFGMCHAGNIGTVKAFTEGLVTQASTMVPCPWFDEAARLAKEHAIPVGVHLTVTAEWDYLRWGPLTGGRTLVGDDSRFRRTIEAVREEADRGEMAEEFAAQIEKFLASGLEPGYFDCHMGIVDPEPYSEVCKRYGKPFLYPIGENNVGFDSVHMLSARDNDEKVTYLIDRIEKMEPGKHLIVSHCAVDSPELRAMTNPKAENERWANDYRVSDLAALTSDEVRSTIERCGVRLTSVADLT